ncbi:MAG: protein-L-isoaspartate(D-aspartate) O-methyltransferase [Xanthobacteraceae bacterium]
MTPLSHAQARREMVERQLVRRGIVDPQVLKAMRDVPREAFVAASLAHRAYDDAPLPLANGQTISQPYVVALMAEAARIGPGDRVLDVGTGSGYAAAVLAQLASKVFGIERFADLVHTARQNLARAGVANVDVFEGDGTLGLPQHAPFDAILVAAAAPAPPAPLKAQLAEGGRLVIPVRADGYQDLLVFTREGDKFSEKNLGPVQFVPLVGKQVFS